MRKKILSMAAVIFLCFAILFNFTSAYEKTWQDVFFLEENSRDMRRLLSAIGPEDKSIILQEINKFLQKENATVDYSKVFISYSYPSSSEFFNYYSNGRTDLNYDGLPDLFSLDRYILLPILRDRHVIGVVFFIDFAPEDEFGTAPYTTVSPNNSIGYYWVEYSGISSNTYAEAWKYAEMGYDILSSAGTEIYSIFSFSLDRALLKTDKGFYVYPAYNIEEPEKGNQAMPLEEYMRAKDKGVISTDPVFVTPTPTRTPFWTPRPSTASTIKPSSNTTAAPSKTAAASPSHAETASPELWASSSSWQKPASSYEPGQTGSNAAVIVLAAAAGCLLIGGIVWAIVSVRKKKP